MNDLKEKKFIDTKADDIYKSYERISTLKSDIQVKRIRFEKEVKEIENQINSQLNLIRMAVIAIWNVTDPVTEEEENKCQDA